MVGLICISLMNCAMEHLFMFICHLCIFFGEVSVMVSGLFVFLLLSFKGSLYILGGSSLSDVSCTNISSSLAYLSNSLDALFCRSFKL